MKASRLSRSFSVAASKRKSIRSAPSRGRVHNGQAGLDEWSGRGADVAESFAQGLPVRVAVVDALADDGDLEVAQGQMEAQVRQVPAAGFRVAGRDLLRVGESRRRRRVRDGVPR